MNSQQVSLPSFLRDLQENKNIPIFKKGSVITLRMMIKEELNQKLFNDKFMKSHKEELDLPHFMLEVEDQHKSWKIIKTLNDILEIQKALKQKYSKIPSVPIRKQEDLGDKNLEIVLQFFVVFMNAISAILEIRQQKCFMKFIDNLVPPQRKKIKNFKQLELRKRAGGRHNESIMKKFASYFITWDKRYFTISTEGVYYTANDQDFKIQEMIPFSVGFQLLYGEKDTCYTYGIMINSAHRLLIMDAQNIFCLVNFVYFIKKAMKENNYLAPKRFKSFACEREGCEAKYYIDGKKYFEDLHDALLTAKSEVCITGWMISPYFNLKRPDPEHKTRLDNVLSKITKNSEIKVHIIVYMQPKMALNIDSQFTETYLKKLSPNIKVVRHPPYVLIPFLWSHHEKMVIIDQKIAFMGGLDIGYGRYDDNDHRLADLNEDYWPGVDYCNGRIVDILKPKEFEKCSIDRKKQPRMPWHDVAVRIQGESVTDLSRHFVQFWNYVNFQLKMSQRKLLMFAGLQEQQIKPKPLQINSMPISLGLKKKSSYIQNRRGVTIQSQNLQIPFDLQIEQETTTKQQGQSNEITQSIINEQELEIDREKEMEFYANYLKIGNMKGNNLSKDIDIGSSTAQRKSEHSDGDLIITEMFSHGSQRGKQRHQILRSASMWSLGLGQTHTERSILEAYIDLIVHSKEFIYIENQFFISVENPISKAIVQRISRAHKNKQKFRIVVVIPSLPGFEGEIYNQDAAVMRIQVHHIYNTICRGKNSILESLNFIKNIDNYIQFYSLRTYDCIGETIVTELIYVHSKVMIVDDRIVIMGSANINDRSLLGSRDSEIAIVIQDQENIQIPVAKSATQEENTRTVTKFAHNLRVQLFMEHFGLTRAQTEDYMNEDTWWKMSGEAEINQEFYRQYFGIYPDNKMESFKDIFQVQKNRKQPNLQILETNIRGNAVLFQKNFLIKENLEIKGHQKQYLVPSINFT